MTYLNFKPQLCEFENRDNYIHDYIQLLNFVNSSYANELADTLYWENTLSGKLTWDNWLKELEKCKQEDIDDIEEYLEDKYKLYYLDSIIQYLNDSEYSTYQSLNLNSIQTYQDVKHIESEALYCMEQSSNHNQEVINIEV